MTTLIVIGGGAAGFFGAIAAARAKPQLTVIILEAGRDFLTKVRISGGGRCNVTHHCFDPKTLIDAYPRGGKALRGAFSRFQPQDTIRWFDQEGISLKTEADGRMFPITDDSATIVNGLRNAAHRAGVQLRTNSPVKTVEKDQSGRFIVTLRQGEALQGERLLIATGSHPSGHRFAQALGHSIIAPVPSLFTFQIKDPRLADLAGVSCPKATLTLEVDQKQKLMQSGAVLVTHWGLSGPATLKLSAWGARVLSDRHYSMPLTINWLPDSRPDSLRQYFQSLKSSHANKKIWRFSPVTIPKRLWQSLAQYVGIAPAQNWADISKTQLNAIVRELTQGTYHIQGKGVFKEEFVTCGGVNLKEINFKTMESRVCPHLYFAGEVLDIDGITGGFNFQSAWTTSWIAGNACATK